MIALITYNKNTPLKSYQGLYDAIKGCSVDGISWWHHLNDTWIIRTTYTTEEIYNILAPHILQNDKLLIVEITQSYQGWIRKDAWDWLENQFSLDNNFYRGNLYSSPLGPF